MGSWSAQTRAHALAHLPNADTKRPRHRLPAPPPHTHTHTHTRARACAAGELYDVTAEQCPLLVPTKTSESTARMSRVPDLPLWLTSTRARSIDQMAGYLDLCHNGIVAREETALQKDTAEVTEPTESRNSPVSGTPPDVFLHDGPVLVRGADYSQRGLGSSRHWLLVGEYAVEIASKSACPFSSLTEALPEVDATNLGGHTQVKFSPSSDRVVDDGSARDLDELVRESIIRAYRVTCVPPLEGIFRHPGREEHYYLTQDGAAYRVPVSEGSNTPSLQRVSLTPRRPATVPSPVPEVLSAAEAGRRQGLRPTYRRCPGVQPAPHHRATDLYRHMFFAGAGTA